jgi:UDP-glucose 4-epimerase
MPVITVIIPTYDEEANLKALYERLSAVAADSPRYEFEFLFVDDGSKDATPEILAALRARDPRVKAVRFSRNFGSHAACLAGLTEAHGDVLVILAADLQDPPELIPEMLAKMETGSDIVLAVRDQREDSWLTVKMANLYHRLMRRYAIPTWPSHGADMVMLRRPVRDVLIRWRQKKNTSIFAQMLWSGFRQGTVFYAKQRRYAGTSKWSLAKKIKLFVDSFISFSFTPVRLISYSGMVLAAFGFAYALLVVLNRLYYGKPIPGWSSIMVVLLFVSGVQLLMLGVIGEYLWRVADEIRGAPPFVIQSRLGIGFAREATGMKPWSEASPRRANRELGGTQLATKPIAGSRILVTGGAGFIGSTIVDHLLTAGAAEVRVLDNFVRGSRSNLAPAQSRGGVTVVEGDVRNATVVDEATAGMDYVFHEAALRITRCAEEPREAVQVLIDGTLNVLEAAARHKVKKVVAASSASVYGEASYLPMDESHPFNNRTPYGAGKIANEQMMRAYYEMHRLPYVAFRYFNVYGPRMDLEGLYTEVLVRWLDAIDKGEPPRIFGDGTQSMDFVFVEDVARANLLALESEVTDEVFNVGTGVPTSLRELCDLLLRLTGSPLQPEYVEPRQVANVKARRAAVEKAERLLGFRAEVDLETGLRQLIRWRATTKARTLEETACQP